ncbi:MAG TPA: D-alanyl-D-alanine carboxypeptidase family protein [Caulobacteraceae bacterium]|jgi:D-alanyl-D-alanine carboxypeptidase (penicillin-binding protein 5/6)
MHEPARRFSYVLATLAASICVVATPTLAQNEDYAPPSAGDLRVPADEPRYAAIVMDASTGEVLYQKRADSERYPASITKIMTLYMAFEALATGKLHEGDMIEVSAHAAAQAPTKLGLRPGDTISVEDAMHAIAVKSANDMAVALAEKIGGGSESRFAAMMTMKAQELGMTHTRYVNANGLPDSRQVTSARDIATLCRAVLRDYPQYYHYFGTEQFTYRGVTMNNHNGLLGRMPGVDGFKTGFTNAAGFNLAASAVRNGRRLITVVLGGSSGASRNANVEDLLLTGFDVEERRGRGEAIMVAQNLFEQPPPQHAVAPQTAQGDSDAIDLVLNAAAHGAPVTLGHAGVTQLAATRPGLVAETPRAGLLAPAAQGAPQAQAQPRNWSVQVGDFRSGKLATAQVDKVADGFRSLFDDHEGQVDHSGRNYRAVFTGFTEAEARSACVTVQAKALPCVPDQR